jgi:uncharacterized membrane protein
MKPFFVLLITFVLALFVIKLINGGWNFLLAGTIAMSAMLLFTSIAHFAFAKGMMMMMPAFIPFKKQIVFATGLLEIITALALLVPAWKHTAAIALIVFFICLLPANINAAINKVDYQRGNYEGSGINYLWFRIPLQVLFIAWVYWFVYRQ